MDYIHTKCGHWHLANLMHICQFEENMPEYCTWTILLLFTSFHIIYQSNILAYYLCKHVSVSLFHQPLHNSVFALTQRCNHICRFTILTLKFAPLISTNVYPPHFQENMPVIELHSACLCPLQKWTLSSFSHTDRLQRGSSLYALMLMDKIGSKYSLSDLCQDF